MRTRTCAIVAALLLSSTAVAAGSIPPEGLTAMSRQSSAPTVVWILLLVMGEAAVLVGAGLTLRRILRQERRSSWSKALLMALTLVLSAVAAPGWYVASLLLILSLFGW